MDNGPRAIKPISRYFREAIRFYELDKPFVAQIIFLLMLAVQFGGYLLIKPFAVDLYTHYERLVVRLQGDLSIERINDIMFDSGEYEALIQSFVTVLLLIAAIRFAAFLVSLFFGSWYFFGLTNPGMTGGQRALVYFSRLPKLIIFNVLYNTVLYFGVFVIILVFGIISFIIPALAFFAALLPLAVMAVSTLFVFKDLLIIEFDIGIFRNFRKSVELTRGSRKQVIINMMCVNLLGWVLSLFAIDVNNALLALFISVFMESIIMIVAQRLSVLMFLDAASIERSGEPLDKDAENV